MSRVAFLLVAALFQTALVSSRSATKETSLAECGNAVNGIHAFTIPSNSPNGPITLLHIQYDATLAVPVTSTAFHDSMNKIQTVSRNDNFRPWDCSELPYPSVQPDCSSSFRMTPEQQSFTGHTSYDRGHISPVNPYRFDFTAQDATFYCVNNAPQEPRTNQGPWNVIEQSIYGRSEAGFVMTGVSSDVNPDGVTNAGYTVPGAYFKMFCYGSSSSATVVGYIGENSLYNKNNATADSIRTQETRAVRSQSEILSRFGRDASVIQQAWLESEQVLLTNREADRAPSAQACIDALSLPADIKSEWTQWTLETAELILKEEAEQQ